MARLALLAALAFVCSSCATYMLITDVHVDAHENKLVLTKCPMSVTWGLFGDWVAMDKPENDGNRCKYERRDLASLPPAPASSAAP